MKVSYAGKLFFGIFLSWIVFSLVALNGCVLGKPVLESKPIIGGKEILVAKDIGGGSPFHVIGWCSNDALLVKSDKFGKEWVDFNGNKVTVSTKETDHLIGCTPDGKWVLYTDRNSARKYRDTEGRTPENIVDEGPGWHGFVMDLYRYEIATGTRQKFAVVRDDSAALVSPDGLKVLLGNRHDWDIEMPEPRWEKVWLTNELDSGLGYAETFWFTDSSGIAAEIWGGATPSLAVEFFGENGWAKEFGLKRSVCAREEGCSVMVEVMDNEKMIYLSTVESPLEVKRAGWAKYRFFRCEITNKESFCEKIGELDEAGKSISALYLLPNGDVIFGRWREDSCIRRLKPGQTHAECIADTRYGDDTYEDVYLIGVSPDGKRMAIKRGKTPPKPGGRFYGYQYDLFVKELSQD